MTLFKLIARASAGYPDNYLLECFDTERNKVDVEANGDTLALFIVSEICETFEPNVDDVDQIAQAQNVLQQAIEELTSVQKALGRDR
jgi:hypothetical protein